MGLPQPVEKMTLDQFCEWVLTQDRKYEYYQGEIFDVYAMAGAKAAHNTVSGNVFAALHNALRGKPCRPFVADMMLRVAPDGAGFYPDVMVTCSEADRARETFKTDAVLVVEVLSESTMGYDLGKKFESYRGINSMQEIVFIDPTRQSVDHYRRDGAQWVLLAKSDALDLQSVGVTVLRTDVFADVDVVAAAAVAA
jgi:Uma2 family endonuclease